MITFYPDIKLVHITAALLSGAFFALRALALLAGMRWPRLAPVRYLSYTVDTMLLTAAFMLLTILPRELYANGWLLAKLFFVAAYVVLKANVEADELCRKRLQDHVKAVIAPYKYPRALHFVAALPKTQTGKIQRFKLREQA